MIKFIQTGWQAVVFAIVGFFALYHVYQFLEAGKVTEASAVFGIAFLSFLYANLSRFKRFKGLGFEAELWEDKQKEAAELIERLKSVVAIYTTEVVRSNVQQGRFADGKRWLKVWPLYDELVTRHEELGQKIDFSKLKDEMDDYFLLDMCININSNGFRQSLQRAHRQAEDVLKKEFGSVVKDMDGYNKRLAQLREINSSADILFQFGQRRNVAEEMLRVADEAGRKLKTFFDVDLQIEEKDATRLRAISEVWKNRPVKVTAELIQWADRQDAN